MELSRRPIFGKGILIFAFDNKQLNLFIFMFIFL